VATAETLDLSDSDDWEDAEPAAPQPSAARIAEARNGGGGSGGKPSAGLAEAGEWEDVDVAPSAGTAAPPSNLAKPYPAAEEDIRDPLPDARLREAEVEASAGGGGAGAEPEALLLTASQVHTPKKPVVSSEQHIHSPFESPTAQGGATDKATQAEDAGTARGGAPTSGSGDKPLRPTAKKKLVLPPAPGSKKKSPKARKTPAQAAQPEPEEADDKPQPPELPASRSEPSGAHPRDGGTQSDSEPATESLDAGRGGLKPASDAVAPSQPDPQPSLQPAKWCQSLGEPSNLTAGAGAREPAKGSGVPKGESEPTSPSRVGSGVKARGGGELVAVVAGEPSDSDGGGGLVPIADSTITIPNTGSGWGNGRVGGYRRLEGAPQGGLQPIADSSVLRSPSGAPPLPRTCHI